MSERDSLFDADDGHRYFSVHCFNSTWELLDKTDRSPADDEQMLLQAQASLWHWTQRDDVTPRNLSIGYWQLSRVYAVLKQAEAAKQAGMRSLEYATGESPFFVGYAHEALARAALIGGERLALTWHLKVAQKYLAEVTDADDRAMLEKDLETLK